MVSRGQDQPAMVRRMGQTYDHCGCKAEKVVDCTDGKWKVEIKEQSAGRPRGYIYHTDRFFVWVMDSGIVWSMVGYDPVKAIHASTFYLSCNTTLRYATLLRCYYQRIPFSHSLYWEASSTAARPQSSPWSRNKSAMFQQHSTTYYGPCLLRYRRRP